MASMAPALVHGRSRRAPDRTRLHLLEVTVYAAAKRASVLASRPEAGVERPQLANGLNRRTLLRPWASVPRTSAVIEDSLCSGADQCGACLSACPRSALVVAGRELRVNPIACTACGACSFVCPEEAISIPGSPPTAIANQIQALVKEGIAKIVLECEHDREGQDADAFQQSSRPAAIVGLPCPAIIGPGLILGIAAAGVELIMSPCKSCPQTDRLAKTLALARRIATACGAENLMSTVGTLESGRHRPSEIRSLAPVDHWDQTLRDVPARNHPEPFPLAEPRSTVAVLRNLLNRQDLGLPQATAAIQDEDSPLAIVRIDRAKCTFCGACAFVCPTHAIIQDEVGGKLSMDAGSCNACLRCVRTCPEDAVTAVRGLDLPMILAGPVTIDRSSESSKCPHCNSPLHTDLMLKSVIRRLAANGASKELLDTLQPSHVCMDEGGRLVP